MLTPPDFFTKIILFRGGYYYAANIYSLKKYQYIYQYLSIFQNEWCQSAWARPDALESGRPWRFSANTHAAKLGGATEAKLKSICAAAAVAKQMCSSGWAFIASNIARQSRDISKGIIYILYHFIY